jgi:hypothetical protein
MTELLHDLEHHCSLAAIGLRTHAIPAERAAGRAANTRSYEEAALGLEAIARHLKAQTPPIASPAPLPPPPRRRRA